MSRRSTLPPGAGPKPPVNFGPAVVVSELAGMTGRHAISVGGETVVYPRARVDSMRCRVTIGRRCVLQERSLTGGEPGPASSAIAAAAAAGEGEAGGVVLGDYVAVEVGAVVEAGRTMVGDGSVVGVGSRVGSGAVVGRVSRPTTSLPPMPAR